MSRSQQFTVRIDERQLGSAVRYDGVVLRRLLGAVCFVSGPHFTEQAARRAAEQWIDEERRTACPAFVSA